MRRTQLVAAFLLMVGALAGGAWWSHASVTPVAQAQFCQDYRVRAGVAGSVGVRTTPDNTAPAVRSFAPEDLICVVGIAPNNGDWLRVRLGDGAGDEGYVLRELVEPGRPLLPEQIEGTQAAVGAGSDYCVGYQPFSGSVVVRAQPSTAAPALGVLTVEDIVCVREYLFDYVYWLGIDDGTGWVDINNVTYVREWMGEQFEDCNAWEVAVPEANIRSCGSLSCEVIRVLPQGTRFCVTLEAEESVEWYGFTYGDGSFGWSQMSLLGPVSAEVEAQINGFAEPEGGAVQAEPLATPTIAPTMAPRAQATGDVVLRAGAVADAEVVVVARAGTVFSVVGKTADNWYFVRMRSGVEGWVSAAGLSLTGNMDAVPLLGAPQRPTEAPATGAADDTVQLVGFRRQAPDPLGDAVCVPYRVVVESALVRAEASLTASAVDSVPRNTEVCYALDVEQPDNWAFIRYQNDLGQLIEGFVSVQLVAPVDGAQAPTPDPAASPTATLAAEGTPTAPGDDPAQVTPTVLTPIVTGTADPVGGTGAVTRTPTPGVCAPGQTENCITPTPAGVAFFAPPTPELKGVLLSQDIPFTTLNLRDSVLNSPQGNTSFNFFLPLDWEMQGLNTLELNLLYSQALASGETRDATLPPLASELIISLNNQLISTLTLGEDNVGVTQTLEIPLPNDLLNVQAFNRVTVDFRAQDHCEVRANALVAIDADQSRFRFQYQEEEPLLDLAQYPRPFYNSRFGTEVEAVVLVLPDEPTNAELEAAASISSGFGLLTTDSLTIRLRRVSELSDFERDNAHLIFIGTPEDHPLVASYYADGLLPTQYDGTDISVGDTVLEPDDGVIQLALNPANDNFAVMVVTGGTADGVRKAAQALGGPPGVLGFGGPLIIIEETRELLRANLEASSADLLTLRDLGETGDIILTGLGQSRYDVTFELPLGAELAPNAYVEVKFNNSNLLNSPNTSFNILVNENPVESIVLSEAENPALVSVDEASGIRTLRAPITPGVVEPGPNSLTFLLSASVPGFECETPDSEVVWLTVGTDSVLNLPRTLAPDRAEDNFVGRFPAPFTERPTLSNVWINLPEAPTSAMLEQVMRMVSEMGSGLTNAEGIRPVINRGALPPGTDTSQYHFIVVGRPSNNPLLAELNAIEVSTGDRFNPTRPLLPQPFVEGTDTIRQVLDDVEYQLPPGYDVGILQMFDSPWNEQRKVLLLTGTGPRGVLSALAAITNDDFSVFDLAGDVVYAAGDTVNFINSERVYQDIEILDAALTLPQEATEAAATVTAGAVQTAVLDAVATIIPPTTTPFPTEPGNPGVALLQVSPTALVTVTPTSTAEVVTTPIPEAELLPPPPEAPPQLIYLVYATGGVIAFTALFMLIRTIVVNRRRERPASR